MCAFKICIPWNSWHMYKFPVIKLSYNVTLPRHADDISGVISDQIPKPSFPLSYLQTSMCGFPSHLQWWLITEKPVMHFYPWAYRPVRQALHVQRSLEYHITLPLQFHHVNFIFCGILWWKIMKKFLIFHRQGSITTRLIPDSCYDSNESYGSASPETTWNRRRCFGRTQASRGTNEHAKI